MREIHTTYRRLHESDALPRKCNVISFPAAEVMLVWRVWPEAAGRLDPVVLMVNDKNYYFALLES